MTALFAFLFVACSSTEETDCFALGGGFGGTDPEAVEAECTSSPRGSGCEANDFIEMDAAKCLTSGGYWSEEIDARYDGVLRYSEGHATVVWVVSRVDSDCSTSVAASTGEWLAYACAEPL